ncbi:unnamed protein product [Ascophyllum nodosum]
MGAKVTLACRSAERGEEAIKNLRAEALAKPVKEGVDLIDGLEDVDVQLEILDLGSLQSVIAFAKRFKEAGSKVDVLINNAGIMALPERKETVDGLEMQIGVNHFGGHLLTRLMVPMIPEGGRVLFTSSIAHKQPPSMPKTTIDWDNVNYEKPDSYTGWMAYSRSKLANVLDAKEFATRLADRKINTYAVHPGVVATELFRNLTDNSFTSSVARIISPFMKYIFATPLTGALTTLKCAIDPAVAGPEFSGKYWGDMKEERPSKLASDPANSSRYWDVTENILETKLGKKVDDLLG